MLKLIYQLTPPPQPSQGTRGHNFHYDYEKSICEGNLSILEELCGHFFL